MNKKTLGFSLFALLISQDGFAHHPSADHVFGVVDPTVGGLVFWVNGNNAVSGNHGLVAAAADIPGLYLYSPTQNNVAAFGPGLYAGLSNTIAIMTAYPGVNNAARACASLCTDNTGKTVDCSTFPASMYKPMYSDWYLPSRMELQLCIQIECTKPNYDFNSLYWSSTQYDESYAYVVQNNADRPSFSTSDKTTYQRIHCIRKF